MSLHAGIDLGSTAIKLVLVEEQTQKLLCARVAPTAPGQAWIVETLLDETLSSLGRTRGDLSKMAVTGYGKGLIEGAQRTIDELSANCLGAFHLSKGRARTVINIGGQDVKVICLSERGGLLDFRMNDKCAAGTGRFFEVAARILDTSVEDFGILTKDVTEPVRLNSTCAVFAESEIVSLMAKGIARERIMQGLHESVARRIAGLCARQELEEEIYLDGGSASNPGLVMAIEDELCRDLHVLPLPQFTVAYGAACSLYMQK